MLQACSGSDMFNISLHTEGYKSINAHNEENGLLWFQSMVRAAHQLITLYTRKSRNTIIICCRNQRETPPCSMHLYSQTLFRKS